MLVRRDELLAPRGGLDVEAIDCRADGVLVHLVDGMSGRPHGAGAVGDEAGAELGVGGGVGVHAGQCGAIEDRLAGVIHRPRDSAPEKLMRKRSSRPRVADAKTLARAAIAAVAIAAPLLVTTTPAEAGVAPYFASCADLTKKWPNGVAKGPVAANKAVRDGYSRPAYGSRAKAVYWENHSRLDRDHDGTACENG